MSERTAQHEGAWVLPPARLLLAADEVHVWRASLSTEPSRTEELYGRLAEDERGRADRFHSQKDRQRFIMARFALRTILANYLDVEPGRLRFDYTGHGKPSLAGDFQGRGVRFNLSHSGDLALYAVCLGREVGIDVEQVRDDFASRAVAERFFSAREVAAWLSLAAAEQTPAFFACWTRKEAYVKARGGGLSLPLDCFDVSLKPGQPARLLRVDDHPDDARRWQMQALDAGRGYAAAVVVAGGPCRFTCYQFPA